MGCYIPNNGYLKSWADQGVLLLNTSLTVIASKANSHQKIGWEIFTDRVIQVLNEREDPVIFILWGGNARSKKKYIDKSRHYIIESVHPSPLSAYNGFLAASRFLAPTRCWNKWEKRQSTGRLKIYKDAIHGLSILNEQTKKATHFLKEVAAKNTKIPFLIIPI